MDMPARARAERVLTPFLKALDQLHFVRKASFAPNHPDSGVEGVLTIRAGKDLFTMDVIQRRSYLDRASLHALSAMAARSNRPLMLFARYIPRPSGEQLLQVGVNFVDEAGNMHVRLGKRYAHTVLGRSEQKRTADERRTTPAQVQMLFAYTADPAILSLPVREIARQAGISKSKAAQIRQQLLRDIRPSARSQSGVVSRNSQQRLLNGYADVLRPKLLIGRFRAQESTADDFLVRLRQTAPPAGVRIALTGGAAAERLQHLYRSPDISLFIDSWTADVRQQLRLLPDREGPLTLLQPMGAMTFWRSVEGFDVAHPWLIFAELMYSEDPRAHEAAEELHREYLAR